jgi:zinc transporter, ZIP family
MWEAAFWGFVGGFALIVGAVVGVKIPASKRLIGLVMAFGSGVLISAVAFDLTEEAFEAAGAVPVVVGLVAGALTFFVGDWIVDHHGGKDRKRSSGGDDEGNASAIVLGAVLDGIPESVAIGVTLLKGGTVGVAVVTAVFLSNIPESLSSATGLRKRHSPRWILGLWTGVAMISAVAAAAGFGLLGGTPPSTIAFVQAFAGGAILTMLADTMMPEAFSDVEHGKAKGGKARDKGQDKDEENKALGNTVGLVTCLGFILAFLLSHA